jgi:hypothetical protein
MRPHHPGQSPFDAALEQMTRPWVRGRCWEENFGLHPSTEDLVWEQPFALLAR